MYNILLRDQHQMAVQKCIYKTLVVKFNKWVFTESKYKYMNFIIIMWIILQIYILSLCRFIYTSFGKERWPCWASYPNIHKVFKSVTFHHRPRLCEWKMSQMARHVMLLLAYWNCCFHVTPCVVGFARYLFGHDFYSWIHCTMSTRIQWKLQ